MQNYLFNIVVQSVIFGRFVIFGFDKKTAVLISSGWYAVISPNRHIRRMSYHSNSLPPECPITPSRNHQMSHLPRSYTPNFIFPKIVYPKFHIPKYIFLNSWLLIVTKKMYESLIQKLFWRLK